MWRFSAVRIIRQDVSGSAGRLKKAMELYKKHDVFVVSDEIWSDLILEGHKHIPTQSVSEDARNRTVAMYAPSKTFNLAGWWEATILFITAGCGSAF